MSWHRTPFLRSCSCPLCQECAPILHPSHSFHPACTWLVPQKPHTPPEDFFSSPPTSCGIGIGCGPLSLQPPLQPLPTAGSSAQTTCQGTFVVLAAAGSCASARIPCALRYWKLDPAQVYASGPNAWDTAVHDASEEYKHRMVGGCA